ncbi:MAG: acyltransferase, partial [Terracidiphilus sp.]
MNASPSYNLYRPDIDGLRAIAVLSVILFHAQLSCSGGFVGVDIFFVISGYLITRIVQRDLESHRFSILEFYQRRIRRIFPAFFAMLLVSAVLGLWLLPPDELQDLGKSMVGASTFCSNIFSFHRSGYFDNSSIYQPLLHTWTLSIEEQFYIFWPLILAVLSISLLARWKLWLVFLILGASLLLSCYLVNHDGNAAFYLLPSRAWELTLGSVLSIAPFPQLLGRMPRLTAHVMSILGLLMLATSITLYNSSILYPGLAALAPCLGTMFIIAAGEGGSSLGGSILSELPLVHIGRISYSLYLWHWPILVFARVFVNGELSLVQRYGCVAITVIISWLSWRFVESPFRNPKIIEGQSRIWVVGGLVTAALFTVLGIVLFSSEGFPQRSPEVARWVAEQRNDYSIFTRSPCMAWKESLPPVHGCLLGAG